MSVPTRLDLLVVLDRSDASARAVQYLADFFAQRRNVHFCLTFLLPKVPAGLLETGGAEQPRKEEQIEAALHEEQERWMSSRAQAAEDIVDTAGETLRRAGVPQHAITSCEMSPLDNRTTVDELLLVAEEHACRTIVIGRRAHPSSDAVGGSHLAEQMLRRAKAHAVWVIE